MNQKDYLHGIRLELMSIKIASNSRQARRERIMCALLSNPECLFQDFPECAAEAEKWLDASDAIDAAEVNRAAPPT
jgi:hypothetical protein